MIAPADTASRHARPPDSKGRLLAVSDLHITTPENRSLVEQLEPQSNADWLIVAGDISEDAPDVEWALARLAKLFAVLMWTPGNHELWTPRDGTEPALRGVQRYQQMLAICRRFGVITPEDPYPIWNGPDGPVRVVPMFLLYDYSFAYKVAATKEAALRSAWQQGVVCSDEFMLHPDPHPSRAAWCEERLAYTERRLEQCDLNTPSVLVNHFPLIATPTTMLRQPVFAQWCGTVRTADWHRRFNAAAAVYGHLHIPHSAWHDGVRFEEVSLGYPRQWQRRPPRPLLRQILPLEAP